MTYREHTKEPWYWDKGNDKAPIKHGVKGCGIPVISGTWHDGEAYIRGLNSDYERIVSCVNSMAGIADPVEFVKRVKDYAEGKTGANTLRKYLFDLFPSTPPSQEGAE